MLYEEKLQHRRPRVDKWVGEQNQSSPGITCPEHQQDVSHATWQGAGLCCEPRGMIHGTEHLCWRQICPLQGWSGSASRAWGTVLFFLPACEPNGLQEQRGPQPCTIHPSALLCLPAHHPALLPKALVGFCPVFIQRVVLKGSLHLRGVSYSFNAIRRVLRGLQCISSSLTLKERDVNYSDTTRSRNTA